MNAQTASWPTEIRLRDKGRVLTVSFDDGKSYDLSAEYLRVESPSAEVQGHSAAQKQTVGGKQNVAITEIQPTGNYALRLIFDDGHSTGIFSWSYLRELGDEHSAKWRDYQARLAAKGLGRQQG